MFCRSFGAFVRSLSLAACVAPAMATGTELPLPDGLRALVRSAVADHPEVRAAQARAGLVTVRARLAGELLAALRRCEDERAQRDLVQAQHDLLARFTRLTERRARAGDVPPAAVRLARLAVRQMALELASSEAAIQEAAAGVQVLGAGGCPEPGLFPALPPDLPKALAGLAAARQRLEATLDGSVRRLHRLHRAWEEWMAGSGASGSFDRDGELERLWRAGELDTGDYLQQLQQALDTRAAAESLRAALWTAWLDTWAASGLLSRWIEEE